MMSGFTRMLVLMMFILTAQLCAAQDDFSAVLNTRLTEYGRQNFQEKLFVHTDKSVYITGEIIWCKLYAVDASLNQPVELSKVAYVEILDRNHTQVLKAKIGLSKGSGNGSFFLPPNLNTGMYILRAYTNWMKNFSADFYFEKIIQVINPQKAPVKSMNKDSLKYDIQFFPESGNLVEGISSKLAFRVAGRNGKGINCSGTLLNQDNAIVASFHTLQFGMGQFYFTPSANEKYHALIQISSDSIVSAGLPEILSRGYVMQLMDSGTNMIKVKVNADGQTDDRKVYLLVHTRQMIKFQSAQNIDHHETSFIIDKNKLGEGISHFTLFNDKGQPVCERLFFKRPPSLHIDLDSTGKEYFSRQNAIVDIDTRDQYGKPVTADLSVSVFLEDSLQSRENADILNYLWLGADLKGNIESPDFYFKDSSAMVSEATDNLMLTHGWTRFRWTEVLQPSLKKPEYLPEYEGHLVTGRILNRMDGQPAENIPAYLSVRDKRFNFGVAASNKDGKIYFNMNGFRGNEEIIVQTNNAYRVEIETPFSGRYSSSVLPPIEYSASLQNSLLAHSISTQVQNAYFYEKSRHFYAPFSDSLVFYGTPDKTYFLDEYTRFTSMEEVLREYVLEVGVRKPEGKPHLIVWKDDKTDIQGDPLVLLDGVPYFDIDSVLQFDPLKIRKLEVVKRRYFLGRVVVDGIVSFRTYDGDLGGMSLDPNALILDYEGLQLEREFFSPVYESEKELKSRLPDFRTTLFWSPDILTDNAGHQKLSFYTSDQPGNYTMIVQGISPNGLAGARVMHFTVKQP